MKRHVIILAVDVIEGNEASVEALLRDHGFAVYNMGDARDASRDMLLGLMAPMQSMLDSLRTLEDVECWLERK